MEQTLEVPVKTFTVWKYVVGGFLAGIITAALNNILFFFLPMIQEVDFPSIIDEMALSIGSFIPPIIASIFYYIVSSKNYAKGTKIYLTIILIGFILSIVIQFFPEQLINLGLLEVGDIPPNLALLTVPFHVTTALVALVFIPKFVGSKED
ncbi:MAG: hypothetical protein ACPGRC_07780 [Salibacteraceae bacterium]